MGNKQGTSSVFQDEEDEETWFEWMEATGDHRNQKRLPISPSSDLLAVHAVQPMSLTPGVTDTAKEAKQRYRSEAKALRGLYLARARTENVSIDSSFRGDAKNNNYLPKLREDEELDVMVGQVLPDFPAGEVNVSLFFDKASYRLKVNIVKARNLCCKAREGKRQDRCGVSCSDLYINVSLSEGQKQLESHRTAKKKGSTDVLFYENFALDLTSLDVRQIILRLTAMHCCKHVINTDHVIGHVDTEDKSRDSSFGSHWVEAITSPGTNVNRWHTLWC